MKICMKCTTFFQEKVMNCQRCSGELKEVTLHKALSITERQALKSRIGGKQKQELPDAYKQYHIRSYLKDRSLFLDFDIYKNRMKHGRKLKRFFVAPINITAIVNIPWFIFNLITSNLFHMEYVDYCALCNSKCNKKSHTREECDYNIEYFNILNDIISGCIIDRKAIYQQYAEERRKRGLKCAYDDLFFRKVRTEVFWDFLSVGLSVAFLLYTMVFVSLPMFKVLVQKIQQLEAYELAL